MSNGAENKHEKDFAHDVFDPVRPEPEDVPLTPEQEAELALMESAGAWPEISRALRDSLDDAAEGAKPDLAKVSGEVLARISPKAVKAPETTGFFGAALALLARFQPHLALAAATAAIVFAVLPIAREEQALTPVAALPTPAPVEPLAVAELPEEPTSVELRRIAFDNSDGAVFHDSATDSTVIWVNEFDGA